MNRRGASLKERKRPRSGVSDGGASILGAEATADVAGAAALLKHGAKLILIVGTCQTVFDCDLSIADKQEKRLIHRLHKAARLSDLHRAVDLVDLIFADQVANRRRGHEHLGGQRAAAPGGVRNQLLA